MLLAAELVALLFAVPLTFFAELLVALLFALPLVDLACAGGAINSMATAESMIILMMLFMVFSSVVVDIRGLEIECWFGTFTQQPAGFVRVLARLPVPLPVPI